MSRKQAPDTEPDDAFSLILGDVNSSPLIRQASDAADHGMQPSAESLRIPLPATAAPEAPLPDAGLLMQSQGPHKQHHSACPPHPSAKEQNSGSQGHPWLGVTLDTCTVRPDPGILESDDPESLAALRQALLAAGEENVVVVRLLLEQRKISSRALALALDCSRRLSQKGGKRLVLSNCTPGLKRLLETMRLQQNHGVAFS